jgi:hypothetical protein
LPKNPTLIAIGLWRSELEPYYPHPKQFIDESWDSEEKQDVITRLKNSYALPYPYAGKSWCRFNCGETEMGNRDYSDGIYLFPEGLVHYIEQHNVKLPNAVVQKMLSTPIEKYNFESDFSVDIEWWKTQTL